MTAPLKKRVEEALRREGERENLARALSTTNAKRRQAVSTMPLWEDMRREARGVKQEVLSRLDHYLDLFSANAARNGMRVHRAADALEACRIVHGIAQGAGARLAVKSKSMVTEEIELNAYLEARGLEVVETDLGEFVAQVAGEKPSHIIAPIIHKSKHEVSELYGKKLGAPPLESAGEITAFTRSLLREKFLQADLGITGANFGLAEEGAVVIVENEGNARLCSTLPRVHVIVMGIERLLPSARELPLFLSLLTVSATGQAISNYVSLIRSPRLPSEKDGPEDVHLVLVDNGRRAIWADPDYRQILACIRCGACLNVCPVYERIGGHAYGGTYQGPVGSVLSPLLTECVDTRELPFLSTLCGLCTETCPVGIPLDELLVRLRMRARKERTGLLERLAFGAYAFAAGNPRTYRFLERFLRLPLSLLGRISRKGRLPFTGAPVPSPRSFHRMWSEKEGGLE
jgi:L-lactate dehydrogenase complex protein LldF